MISMKAPLPVGSKGGNYSQQFTGYTGIPPFVFTVQQQQGQTGLPPGLSMSGAGLLSGTIDPSAASQTYTFNVLCVDQNGNGEECFIFAKLKVN